MKAAIYCRLSEEDRNKQSAADDSESIQNQKSMLLNYAVEQGWEVYNIYSDDDYAGADRNRPEFNRLLEDAEHRKFDIVLCKTQSRFTRELELVEKYIHGLFPLWNIRFVSIVDNADTANKGNKKSRQINGLVNEWYLEDMSENIKSVLTNKRLNGLHIGAFALYGYKKDPERKGRLVIDEEAAEIVREVFTLFSQGWGKTAIARLLNDRGIPNPTEYKRLKGLRYSQPKSKNGILWKYSAISSMLANEIYIGNMVQGRYGSVSYKTKENRPVPKERWIKAEGTHEPIIEKPLWDNAQAIIRSKAKPFAEGNIGLFARKARCMYCGYTLRSSKNHGRHYLKCPTRHISDDACIGAFISADVLEKAVAGELHGLAGEYLDMDSLELGVDFHGESVERMKKIKAEIIAYGNKASEYAKAVRDTYMDKVRGIITESDFLELSKTFSAEKARFEQLLTAAREQASALEAGTRLEREPREIAAEYTGVSSLTREMIDKFVEYISVGRREPETKEIEVEIHWSF